MSKVRRKSKIRTLLVSVLAGLVVLNTATIYSAYASGNQSTEALSAASSDVNSNDGSDEVYVIYGGKTEGKNCRFKPNAVYNGSYRSELTEHEALIYDAMYTQVVTNKSNEEVSIDFTGLGYTGDDFNTKIADMIDSSFFAFTYDHPEAFWVRGLSYSGAVKSNGELVSLYLTFTEYYPNAFSEMNIVNAGITSAVNSINSSRESGSRYHTLKAIHDYICNNVSYDYDVLEGGAYAGEHAEDQTVAPLFGGGRRGHKYVCAGYAASLKLLCERFGIPCVRIYGSAGGPHAWNLVQMEDGKWYAVDVTWDDGNTIDYTYFLVGSDIFNSEHSPITDLGNYNPLAYPTMSETRYVYSAAPDFSFWDWQESIPTVSDNFKVWMRKYNWDSSNNCDVNISIDGVHRATIYSDDNGFFSYTIDTTQLSGGEHTITAVFRTTSGVEITDQRTFIVAIPATSVTLSNTTLRTTKGITSILLATVQPNNSTDTVTWSSSNPSVATVSGGKVKALAIGVSTITAKAGDKSAKCTVTVVPKAPSAPKATTVDFTSVKLNWTAGDDAQFVEVWRTHKANAVQSEYVQLGIYYANAGTSMSRSLTPGKTYYYKFRAYSYDSSKQHKYYSDYSQIVSATAKPLPAPYNVKATRASSTSVKLTWTASSNAQFVEVWRTHKANAVQSEYVQLGIYYADAGTSMSRSLTTGKTYYYKFRAYSYDSNNKKVFSGYSTIVSATP